MARVSKYEPGDFVSEILTGERGKVLRVIEKHRCIYLEIQWDSDGFIDVYKSNKVNKLKVKQ